MPIYIDQTGPTQLINEHTFRYEKYDVHITRVPVTRVWRINLEKILKKYFKDLRDNK